MSNFVFLALLLAFHNLQSKIPIDWATDTRAEILNNPCRLEKLHEQTYIKNVYNQRINRKMIEKYNSSFDTFRAIPNDLTMLKDRDVLSKELEQFNTSKFTQNMRDKHGIEHEQSPIFSYNSLKEMPTLAQQKKEGLIKLNQSSTQGSKEMNSPENTDLKQYTSLQQEKANKQQGCINQQQSHYDAIGGGLASSRYKDPYTAQRDFTNDLMKQYRSYAERSPNSPDSHPFRNLLPDKLEEFLRERQQVERKSRLRASLSHSKRVIQP